MTRIIIIKGLDMWERPTSFSLGKMVTQQRQEEVDEWAWLLYPFSLPSREKSIGIGSVAFISFQGAWPSVSFPFLV